MPAADGAPLPFGPMRSDRPGVGRERHSAAPVRPCSFPRSAVRPTDDRRHWTPRSETAGTRRINGFGFVDLYLVGTSAAAYTLAVISNIHDLHVAAKAAGKPAVSIEFFPPKTDEGDRNLFEKTLPALMTIRPSYCSVTYGAGGSTRDKTLTIVERIQKEFHLTAMMHLTCVNATQAELASVIADARSRGVKNILALRGDPPAGSSEWTATEGGFRYSRELVAYLEQIGGFDIGTAGFPEGHIAQAGGREADWGFLADKIRAGADFVVTQLFFDNADFLRMRDHLVKKLGVDVPLIPGMLPVVSRGQTKRFTAMCGAALPASFVARLDELGDDDAAVTQFGIDYCAKQCEELIREGVPGIHFYTLNKAHSTVQVVKALGLA